MRPPGELDARTWRLFHHRLDAAAGGAASLSHQRFMSRPFAAPLDFREGEVLRLATGNADDGRGAV